MLQQTYIITCNVLFLFLSDFFKSKILVTATGSWFHQKSLQSLRCHLTTSLWEGTRIHAAYVSKAGPWGVAVPTALGTQPEEDSVLLRLPHLSPSVWAPRGCACSSAESAFLNERAGSQGLHESWEPLATCSSLSQSAFCVWANKI